MTTMLMYEQLIAVNRDQHRHWRIRPGSHKLAFAKATNSVLLAASELPMAALDYPCVFVGAGEHHTMAAIVGLRDKENLMLDTAGNWDADSYVPAFVRRYPFVLAEQPGSTQLTICMDRSFDGFNETEGEALFDEQGQDTAYLSELKTFLINFHQDMQRSAAFANELARLDLLVERNIACHVGEQTVTLSSFKVVDEERLSKLPQDTVLTLFKTGALGWIHAHLLSLNNVKRLGARLSRLSAS